MFFYSETIHFSLKGSKIQNIRSGRNTNKSFCLLSYHLPQHLCHHHHHQILICSVLNFMRSSAAMASSFESCPLSFAWISRLRNSLASALRDWHLEGPAGWGRLLWYPQPVKRGENIERICNLLPHLPVLQMEAPQVVIDTVADDDVLGWDMLDKAFLHIFQACCHPLEYLLGYPAVLGVVV